MTMKLLLACAGLALVGACARASAPSTTAAAGAAVAATGDQVARGGKLYGEHCAKCHGDAGQGTDKAPPVVGPGSLPLDPRPGQKRKAQFHTAKDVASFV